MQQKTDTTNNQLRARRAPYQHSCNVYDNITLLVLNGTSLNSDSTVLALNWQNVPFKVQQETVSVFPFNKELHIKWTYSSLGQHNSRLISFILIQVAHVTVFMRHLFVSLPVCYCLFYCTFIMCQKLTGWNKTLM